MVQGERPQTLQPSCPGVYVHDGAGGFAFHCNKAPTVEQLIELLHIISQRVASFLFFCIPYSFSVRHIQHSIFLL
jgi:hypothetical protein